MWTASSGSLSTGLSQWQALAGDEGVGRRSGWGIHALAFFLSYHYGLTKSLGHMPQLLSGGLSIQLSLSRSRRLLLPVTL